MEPVAVEHAAELDQLTGVAIVILVALGCGIAMVRFRQPAVVGYILAGVVLGPSAFGLVENRELIQTMAELGVLMLLYLVGMELSLQGFKAVWKLAVGVMALQFLVAFLAMAGFAWVLDWDLPRTLLFAFVLTLSSTAVAIKMLEDLGDLRNRIGQITVGVLIAQDLAVVPMMLVLGSFGGGEAGIGWEGLVKVVLSVVFLASLIIFLVRRQRLRLPFSELLGKKGDLVALAGLTFCFGAAAVSGLLGLSAAYGAFLAGLIIGNSTARAFMIRTTEPIQAVLVMVFFLSIGLLIDLRFLWENLALVALMVAMVMVVKTVINVTLLRLFGESWPRAFVPGVLLGSIGEFAFVLGAMGLTIGAIGNADYRLIITVTALALLLSPLWLLMARRLQRFALAGVTSGRELWRLVVLNEVAGIARTAVRSQDHMVGIANNATRWVGDLLPQRRRHGPGAPAEGAARGPREDPTYRPGPY